MQYEPDRQEHAPEAVGVIFAGDEGMKPRAPPPV